MRFYLQGTNKTHNIDAPAIITYYESGNLKREEYYRNGLRHNASAPAVVEYNEDGSVIIQYYYLHGKYYNDILSYMVALVCDE